jgi:tetratricopeptide (TPR) repeat protein
VDPENPDILMNLGDALKALGEYEQAVQALRGATEKRPGDATPLVRLANLQGDSNCIDEAVENYRRALKFDANNIEALLNLGCILLKRGETEAAEECYRKALGLDPNSAETHSNLGVVMKRSGQMDAALTYFERALVLRPDFCEAHINLGTVFQAMGNGRAAVACYQRALHINPVSAQAHSNHGDALLSLDDLEQAEVCYLRALEIDPRLKDAYNGLGILYGQIRRLDDAVESYESAINIDPSDAGVYSNLGGVLKDLGRLDESLNALQKALDLDPSNVVAHNNLLFIHNYISNIPPSGLLIEAQRFGDMVARLAQPYIDWPNSPDQERLLRVGFVSGDLHGHPVGYFLDGVLASLAAKFSANLELFAYPTRACEDETTKRLRASCKAWRSTVGLSDAALAQRIREDGIDILVDLSGHTAGNRLPMFAWKPAPIQVSWLGYFATTGVATMDYFVADPWTLPQNQEPFFTEKIWRLPETRLCFTPPNAKVDVNALPALTNGYVTFGCFNNLSKMNDAVVQLWARVLNAVPASRLFLKYQQLAEASVRQSTRERFAVHGITAERLIFEDYVPRANYLAAYHRVDIALDPFPFPGGTTTVEALWMGIPVLTLSGERFLARQGVGLLMNAGLSEWIALDHDDYLARAVAHAGDLQGLAALRARLRQQVLASPIYDAPRFAEHLEAALREMWRKWCANSTN